jgi:NAD(P)-dependent dehydrogenase (short-subunit alcohol dehydrogenase family)
MSGALEGKVAIVTGAAGGIGRATSLRFAADGASVVLVDLPSSALDDALQAVREAGAGAIAAPADVSNATEVERYAEAAVRQFGGVDVLFNNAGIEGHVGSMLTYPEETFDRVIAVNLKGVWLGMRAVVPRMRQRGGGAIVNTSSIAGLRGSAQLFAYNASKHAVIGMTRSAAMEFARDDIRINAIAPGPVDTRMMRSLERGINPDAPDDARRAYEARAPLQRYADPAEIAALVTFLCSAEASFITGAVYPIDGGYTA